jgi:chemotaxis protein MotB
MKLHHPITLTIGLAGLLVVTGCVSTGKYKKLESDKDAEIEAQSKEISQLEGEVADLKVQNRTLGHKVQKTRSDYSRAINRLSKEVQSEKVKITQFENMLTFNLAEQIFFASGSTRLKKEGEDVLLKVADAIKEFDDKLVRVVGHTDNIPVSKKLQHKYPSNWEVSVLRASTVVRFLQSKGGIPAENLIAVGMGDTRPVAPNDTVEGRRKNRRIEITLLDRELLEAIKTKE